MLNKKVKIISDGGIKFSGDIIKAIAAGADGVMIEVHPDPSNAAVDPLQPIDYQEFDDLMKLMHKICIPLGREIL